LLKVMLCAVLVAPTDMLPNARLEGERLATEVVPVPDRETLCGLPVALSAMLMIAARSPAAVGLKVMLMVQLDPELRLDPQVSLRTKSAALPPATAMLVKLIDELPVLLKVTDCAVLAEPTD